MTCRTVRRRRCRRRRRGCSHFPGKTLCPSLRGSNQSILSLALTHQMSEHKTAQNKRTQAGGRCRFREEMIGKVLPGCGGGTTVRTEGQRRGGVRLLIFPSKASVVSLVMLILDNRCAIIAALSFFSGVRVSRRAPTFRVVGLI